MAFRFCRWSGSLACNPHSADYRFVSLGGEDYLVSIREAAANRISGGAIYDALIARCAVRMGADQIFTWNTRHTNCWAQMFPNASRAPSSTD
jgi:hypothetical protein